MRRKNRIVRDYLMTLLSVLSIAGCVASPPEGTSVDGTLNADNGSYAGFASCFQSSGKTTGPCPSLSCANQALGAPDGKAVDLAMCSSLDVAIAGGTTITNASSGDLVIHTVAPAAGTKEGAVIVQGSSDGVSFVNIGFINEVPAGAPSSCLARRDGLKASINMSICNLLSNATYFRLTDSSRPPRPILIDAIQAVTFTARRP